MACLFASLKIFSHFALIAVILECQVAQRISELPCVLPGLVAGTETDLVLPRLLVFSDCSARPSLAGIGVTGVGHSSRFATSGWAL